MHRQREHHRARRRRLSIRKQETSFSNCSSFKDSRRLREFYLHPVRHASAVISELFPAPLRYEGKKKNFNFKERYVS